MDITIALIKDSMQNKKPAKKADCRLLYYLFILGVIY